MMIGYVHSLAQLAVAGNDVVAEAVIIPERRQLYRDALAGVPVLLVGVRCTLRVAQERERARTDRGPLDLDVPWFETVHQLPYDLEVDMTDESRIEAAASQVIDLVFHPPAERAFDRLN